MKLLSSPPPTAEQLKIISERRLGVEIIRGAAGSGKTTTALLRLQSLTDMMVARRRRLGLSEAVRILVLTYNRTLCGYIEALARAQTEDAEDAEITINTFANWAWESLGRPHIVGNRKGLILPIAAQLGIKLPPDFLCAEVEYVLGRFPQGQRNLYLERERTGRGIVPRVDQATRSQILVLLDKYFAKLEKRGWTDWEQLPERMLGLPSAQYELLPGNRTVT